MQERFSDQGQELEEEGGDREAGCFLSGSAEILFHCFEGI